MDSHVNIIGYCVIEFMQSGQKKTTRLTPERMKCFILLSSPNPDNNRRIILTSYLDEILDGNEFL